MRPSRILIVEDDEFTRRLLAAFLEKSGFQVTEGSDGRALHAHIRSGAFDLVILDLNLPDEDGLVLTRQVRSRNSVPLIILTSRQDESDRLIGFDLGADDYLTKPCNPNELLARVRAVLNRTQASRGEHGEQRPITFGRYALDLERHRLVDADGREIPLTAGEFQILSALARAKGRVLSRGQLADAVSGVDEPISERSVDVLISRLRRKVEKDPKEPEVILTQPRYGYRLAVD
jgi:DNA-binding response OmpR family regulator